MLAVGVAYEDPPDSFAALTQLKLPMAYYSELTTVKDVRDTYSAIVGTGDDALFLSFIRAVSTDIARAARRTFVPRVETRYFDARADVMWRTLVLDDDLLSITTLTNGDSTTVSAASYATSPRNGSCFYDLQLLASSGLSWTYATDPENAVSLAGVWGFDCSWLPGMKSEWIATDTLNGAIVSTSATTFATTGSALVRGGQLLKIDSEYMYVSSVATVTPTVIRGVNGSTAATHLTLAPVYVWTVDAALEQLAKECAAATYRLRSNPLAETFVAADGTTFVSPKDIFPYIEKRIVAMGLRRN